ncbi:cAMP-dependent protein kinase subunit [Stylosanthes scabra]|uniref:cAMP-dependent protein kinase subunit n=1 Tax=Stylosanthes scabra TaxID=79078 RepID=A0ABU6XE33_9FABA|nr:cAMP-dependent protein kinase subunit [Stylosanthes scabra]
MAKTEAKEPLLSRSEDLEAQKFRRQLKKRRLRRARSAPCNDADSPDTNGNIPVPRSESIFGNIHPSFRRVAMYLTLYIGIGAVVFYLVGNQIKGLKTDGVLDAIYFTVVTMTTVGYGDIVPNSNLTKLLACAFVFSGMALVGLILGQAADYLVEKQEVLLVKAMHMHQHVGEREILKEVEVNKARYKFLLAFSLLLIMIIVGTVFLVTVEKLEVIDAFYCVCSTLTTLGYGDKSFSTEAGRIFAVFWILAGTISLAQVFLYIAELNTESRQKAIVKWVLSKKMTNLDLEAADLDDDGSVGAAEFVVYKLKEMGKISQEDISVLLQEFEELDVDESGTLSVSDLAFAQSS